ncbi:MAG: hypothetical protein J6K18_04455 [Bacilli bacterium]|nr:hypothetical protein [Bacilli bacterium]
MKIIPVKFIVGLSIICLIIFPILFYIVSFLLFYILSIGNSIVPYHVIFITMAFGIIIEIMFIVSPEYCKLVINNGTISNFIFDGTHNDGWCESISNIKKIELVGKEEVQKYFKQFNKSKAILIDFGNYKVKYIYAGGFSKKQIQRIFNLLRVNKY